MLLCRPLYLVLVGDPVDRGASAMWRVTYRGLDYAAARAEWYVADSTAPDPDLVLLVRCDWKAGVVKCIGDLRFSDAVRPVFDGQLPGECALENVVCAAIVGEMANRQREMKG